MATTNVISALINIDQQVRGAGGCMGDGRRRANRQAVSSGLSCVRVYRLPYPGGPAVAVRDA